MLQICVNVKVNTINTWCILMSEAVAVPSLTDDKFTQFPRPPLGGTDCHTDTQTFASSNLNVFKVKS